MKQKLFSTKGLLFIIPILLLFTLCYNIKEINLASIGTVDPEYTHVISSVNLANGQYEILSIENPATSLYLLSAVVVKATHLLTNHSITLTDDFLLHSEKYIFAVRISLLITTLLSILFLGLIVYKYTGNFYLSILLQLVPFTSIEFLNSSAYICAENFLIIVMIWYTILLVILSKELISEYKAVVYFAIIAALGIATKLTFLPLLFIPLILFSNNKYRIYYLILTGVLAMLIAFPVVMQYHRFYDWLKGIALHTGQYGKGESKIIDVNMFFINLKSIMINKIFFSITYLLLLITVLVLTLIKKKRVKNYILLLTIFVVFTIQIVLTSKHFAYRYLIPSMMLTTYILYELGIVYISYLKSLNLKIIKIVSILFIIGFGLIGLNLHNNKNKEHTASRMSTYSFIKENIAGKPMIVIPNYFGASAIDYSLYFAAIWTGKYRDIYYERLNKLYPNTYFYIPWDNKYYKWNMSSSLMEILKKYDCLYVYGALDATDANEEDFNKEIKNKFNFFNSNGDKTIEINEVFKSKYDVVYKLTINKNTLINFYLYETIKCDMETVASDSNCFETNSKYKFSNDNNIRNSSTAFSSKYSQLLDKAHPWGSKVKINEVKSGNNYEVTLWKKSTDKNCLLVATLEDANEFYITSNTICQVKNGWEQVKLTFEANDKLVGKELLIYIWYNGEGSAFVDDFQITIGSIP